VIRRVAARLLVDARVPRLARALRGTRGAVLAYHNIVPDGAPPAGDRSLHLPVSGFARQLDLLVREYEVVPLERLLTEPSNRRSRPRVSITLDDAYHGALALGVPELCARRLPATLFVAPALLGRDGFWWDALAGPDGLDPGFRRVALEACCGRDEPVRWRAAELGLTPSPPLPLTSPATVEELTVAAARPGITVASHGWDHANLTAIPLGELKRQLRLSLSWLRERFTAAIPWLSYPYGLSSDLVEAQAAAAGYVAALRITGGAWGPATASRHRLPRVNVPSGVSGGTFLLRAAGLVGG
jgi:peptidoglycan/xylan/chitin deacetylase (PgdA/CDA1 family)